MFHLLPKGKVEKTAGFPIAPHCPHNYIKVLTDRLIDFAQTCPVPLASGHRETPCFAVNPEARGCFFLSLEEFSFPLGLRYKLA